MAEEDDENVDGGRGLGRTLALSDGIFAIAMTLVAFQIQPPKFEGAPSQLAGKLGAMGTQYLVYVITFAVIGLLWLAHHRLFRYVVRTDDVFMLVNLLFLMIVAALPFPSGVLGMYGSQRSAVVLYASSMALAGFTLTALTLLAHRRRLFAPTVPPGSLGHGLWRSGSMAVTFTLSIPLAVVAPTVTPYAWLIVMPLRFMNPTRTRRFRRANTRA